ncbi:MAG: Wzz/FepE/Etk N-terminal domain-containing protein [Candidatus Sulfotelmatobacter sp.]
MTPRTDTMIEAEPIAVEEGEAMPRQEAEISLLDLTLLLVQNKRFIARFVLGTALLAIVVAFLLPVRYEAKVTLMPPAQHSSLGSALLGELGNLGALGSLTSLAGMKTPSDMYVSLLTSRTVEDAMINKFGLMAEYRQKRMSDARKVFENHTTVVASSKDGLIRITLEDSDPKRAAELANGYVEAFRELSASLAITEAARRRLFFQQELEQAKKDLTAAEEAMQKTQQSTGVLQIDSQARALIESAAVLRAQVVAKEVEIQGMRSYAAEDNPQLLIEKQQLAALQSQLQQIAGSQQDTGSDIVLSKGRVTGSGLEYLRRIRELKYRETVFELLAKELEIAKLDEAREGEIVQVVDPAVVPDKKSSPHRTLIIIGATIMAFIGIVLWIVIRQGLNRAFELPENRRRLNAIKAYWSRKADRIESR